MIRLNDPDDGYAIADRAGTVFNPAVDRVIARVEDGVLWGGNIFTDYTGTSIHTHTAGFRKGWANRDFLWVIFDYPFNQLGCRKVFGQVSETNTGALEIYAKMGFKVVAKIDDVFPDGACLVIAMTRDDCRWLNVKPRGIKPGART